MADPGIYNAILEENKNLQTEMQEVAIASAVASLAETPWDASNWSILPLLDSPTGCLCVQNLSLGSHCGVCCFWTVPGGASKVQFQMWGAGSGTTVACCCGGSEFGANGAYATVIIDAVPGCNYTLCAGCAVCCRSAAGGGTLTSNGCPSFVSGFGLTSVSAPGGQVGMSCHMFELHNDICCRYRSLAQTGAANGPCLCESGNDYCFANNCATCNGPVENAAVPATVPTGTATTGTVYGFPSFYGTGCLDTANAGYFTAPPVISICHEVTPLSDCCWTFTSSACAGGCLCSPSRQFPGAGGWASNTHAGANLFCGDTGRGGMVRVTWC
jgi:hypothetical protein